MSDEIENTCVVVAIPGANTAPVLEDGQHITLCYLGEKLSEAEAMKLVTGLQGIWRGPFVVDTLGTGFLGEAGEAHVLLLDKPKLSALRDKIMGLPGVAEHMASVEQFPEYTPHMTLGYLTDGYEPVDQGDTTQLEIIGIGVWNGEDQLNVGNPEEANENVWEEVGHTTTGLRILESGETASGIYVKVTWSDIGNAVQQGFIEGLTSSAGEWAEHLHPRGKDGKFIRKFGIVKFLSGLTGNWEYGKVVGMSEPEGGSKSGSAKITVRPSNLHGEPTGKPDIDLPNSKIYSAPVAKAKLSTEGMKNVGGQAGSNPGGFYVAPAGVGDDKPKWFEDEKWSKVEIVPGATYSLLTRHNENPNFAVPGGGANTTSLWVKTPGDDQWRGINEITGTVGGKISYNDAQMDNWQNTFAMDFATLKIVPLSKEDWTAPGDLAGPTTYYVKQAKTQKHGRNEALANALYEEAGVAVPEVSFNDETGEIFSKVIPDAVSDANSRIESGDAEWLADVQDDFVVDAWLANWDVFGLTNDNIMTDANGKPIRIDAGGALLYRAQGQPKQSFDGHVAELSTLKQKRPKVYATMTKEQEIEGAKRVLAISPERIEELVSEHHMAKSLADTLKTRRMHIALTYNLPLPESLQPSGSDYPTSAPLVDPVDDMLGGGLSREWSRATTDLFSIASMVEPGDEIRTAAAGTAILGQLKVSGEKIDTGSHLAALQALGGPFQVKKVKTGVRAPHNTEFGTAPSMAIQLADFDWQRGDRIILDGTLLNVLGVNRSTKMLSVAPLQQEGATEVPPPVTLNLLNLPGDKVTTLRWNPEALEVPKPEGKTGQAKEKLEEIKADLVEPIILHIEAEPKAPLIQDVVETPVPEEMPDWEKDLLGVPTPDQQDPDEAVILYDDGKPEAKGKKSMILGDGTKAETGDKVFSKITYDTYTFVKPKGQYAVVTYGPEDKEYLKKASTLTQPTKAPGGVPEKPKSANGMTPQLGMVAAAKDGKSGEIFMISPAGDFIYFNYQGKKIRKSTKAVTLYDGNKILDGPSSPMLKQVVEQEVDSKNKPGAVVPTAGFKDVKYGVINLAQASDYIQWAESTGPDSVFVAGTVKGPHKLTEKHLIWAQHADGTLHIEPYKNQPWDAVLHNGSQVVPFYSDSGVTEYTMYATDMNHVGPLASGAKAYLVMVPGGKTLTVYPEWISHGDGMPTHGMDGQGNSYWFYSDATVLVNATNYPKWSLEALDKLKPTYVGHDDEPLTGEMLPLSQLNLVPGSKISYNGVDWMEVTGVDQSYITTDTGFVLPRHTQGYFLYQPPDTWTSVKPGEYGGQVVKSSELETLDYIYGDDGSPLIVTDLVNNGKVLTVVDTHGEAYTYYVGANSDHVESELVPLEQRKVTLKQLSKVISATNGEVGGKLYLLEKGYEIVGAAWTTELELVLRQEDGLLTKMPNSLFEDISFTVDFAPMPAGTTLWFPGDAEVTDAINALKNGKPILSADKMASEDNPYSVAKAVEVLGQQVFKTPTDIYRDEAGNYWREQAGQWTYWSTDESSWAKGNPHGAALGQITFVISAVPPPTLDMASVEIGDGWLYTKDTYTPPPGMGVYTVGEGLFVGPSPSGPFYELEGDGHPSENMTQNIGMAVVTVYDPWTNEGFAAVVTPSNTPTFEVSPGVNFTPDADMKVVEVVTFSGAKLYLTQKGKGEDFIAQQADPVPLNQTTVDSILSGTSTWANGKIVWTGPEYDAENPTTPSELFIGKHKVPDGYSVYKGTLIDSSPLYYVQSPGAPMWILFDGGGNNIGSTPTLGDMSSSKVAHFAGPEFIATGPSFSKYVAKPGDKIVKNLNTGTYFVNQSADDDFYHIIILSNGKVGSGYWTQSEVGSDLDLVSVYPTNEETPQPVKTGTLTDHLTFISAGSTAMQTNVLTGAQSAVPPGTMAALKKAVANAPVPAGWLVYAYNNEYSKAYPGPDAFYYLNTLSGEVHGVFGPNYSGIEPSIIESSDLTGETASPGLVEINLYSISNGPVDNASTPPGHSMATMVEVTSKSQLDGLGMYSENPKVFYFSESKNWAQATHWAEDGDLYVTHIWDSTEGWKSTAAADSPHDSGMWLSPGDGVYAEGSGSGAAIAAEVKKPSLSEEIAAWNGDLLKTGQVPKSGMAVTGKGPMMGVIISINKAKTNAVVLTSDGKKTTRQIKALSISQTQGINVLGGTGSVVVPGTVKETLKQVFDNKFSTMLPLANAHPGILGAYTVATNVKAPSGKTYARVMMSLTKAQRKKLAAMLATNKSPEVVMGDWVKKQIGIKEMKAGDKVSLRFSKTQDRWIPNKSATDDATHEIVSVGPWENGQATAQFKQIGSSALTTAEFKDMTKDGANYLVHTYTFDMSIPAPVQPSKNSKVSLSSEAKAAGWAMVDSYDFLFSKIYDDDFKRFISVEPGDHVGSGSTIPNIGASYSKVNQNALRAKLADGTVIEVSNLDTAVNYSSSGVVVISIPEGGKPEDAYGSALKALGLDFVPHTQASLKPHILASLRGLIQTDKNDLETTKGMSEADIFAKVGQTVGIPDVGWQDISVRLDPDTGTPAYYWSERVLAKIKAKNQWNVVQRGGKNSGADRIVSVVKNGSPSSMVRTISGLGGGGASVDSDNSYNTAGGSYLSAGVVTKFTSANSLQGGWGGGMMVYYPPEAALARIIPFHPGHQNDDNYGKGYQNANPLEDMMTGGSAYLSGDFWVPGGLNAHEIGFIGVLDSSERAKALSQLAKEGITHIGKRPVEEVILPFNEVTKRGPKDFPTWEPPADLVPFLELPETIAELPVEEPVVAEPALEVAV